MWVPHTHTHTHTRTHFFVLHIICSGHYMHIKCYVQFYYYVTNTGWLFQELSQLKIQQLLDSFFRLNCLLLYQWWTYSLELWYHSWERSSEFEAKKNEIVVLIWCDFDRALSLICGNKMPTRCNRGFYCRSYCLLNMFQAPLCPSSGAQEYYTMLQHPANRTHNPQLHTRPATWKSQHEIPQAATIV